MKKLLKMALILSGIFMTTAAFAQETADPNTPVLILTPASQPATPAVTTAPAPAPIQLSKTDDLVRKKTRMYQYAVSNVLGVTADENGAFTTNKNWRTDGEILNYSNGVMQVETKEFSDNKKAIFTVSTKDGRATAAFMDGSDVHSYTVVNNDTHYTITPAFCEIMRSQTKSKNFEEMKTNAATCEIFYDRAELKPNQLAAIPSIIDADRRNLGEMKKSVAKSMVPKTSSETDVFMRKLARTKPGQFIGMDSVDPSKPRNVLSKKSTATERADRMVMTEIASACANLWPEGYDDGLKSTAPAAKPAKSGATTK